MNVRRAEPKPTLMARLKHLGRWLRSALLVGVALSLVAAVMSGSVLAYRWLDKPIEVIAVKGEFKHIQQGELEGLVAPVLDGGIISLDLTRIDQVLETHVWIKQALVSRQWPDAIVIEVIEETPIARWGDQGFLNSQGELLDVEDNRALADLPLLVGPTGSELVVMKRYREIAQLLQLHQLRVLEVSVDDVGFWQLRLHQGPQLVVGTDHIMDKVRRFLVVWEKVLQSQTAVLATVDLRYDNGLAVKWKEQNGKAQQTEAKS